jgi:hypothetical protein
MAHGFDPSYSVLQIILSMIFLTLVYFLNGLPAEWYRFVLFCFVAITVCLVAEGLGLAIGSVFSVTVSIHIYIFVMQP